MTGDAATLAFAGLQPEDIVATLTDLGFDCDGRFLALNSYENRVYQIGIEDERPVVAKFYRPGRWSDKSIREEHEFSLALAAQEIPVVPPLEIDGDTLKQAGHYRLAVFLCRGGRAPDLDNYELLTQLGRLVARIHLEGEVSPFKHRPRIDINSYGVESIDYLLDNDFIPEENCAAYESIVELVLDGVEACFERAGNTQELRLHGDFHPGNVLVNQDRLHIVDLDDCRHGPAVQDLWMFLSGGLHHKHERDVPVLPVDSPAKLHAGARVHPTGPCLLPPMPCRPDPVDPAGENAVPVSARSRQGPAFRQ